MGSINFLERPVGNSSITLENVFDEQAAMGIYDPRNAPSGYGLQLALRLGNDTLSDLIAGPPGPNGEYLRFNWKWNRAIATPFLTNSFQQDYPQLAQPSGIVGWGDDCDKIDINNTMVPKPVNVPSSPKWKRNLSRISAQFNGIVGGPTALCWMYNNDLSWGTWPGAGVTYAPLITSGAVPQNPIMNFIDSNGNYLILTGYGTTGTTAPSAPANSAEGVTVIDGNCQWTVVSGTSQGFRIWPLPGGSGPVYQIIPNFQFEPPVLTSIGQALNPIPNSFIRHFRRALEFQSKMADPDPNVRSAALKEYPLWLVGLKSAAQQGDKEMNAYGLMPATSPVDNIWPGNYRYTADQPF
ncbi:MAG: hypothetical protein WCA89_12835 [Terracidiphilus sp.]